MATRSVDNKITLMNYLADWCFAHQPELLAVGDELSSAGDAMRQPLTAWLASFKQLQAKVFFHQPSFILFFFSCCWAAM